MYSLPHKNSRNALVLLHFCITALRSNCRSKGEHHALQTRLFVAVILLPVSRSEARAFRFIELKSLFVTTLTQSRNICSFDAGETHTPSIVVVIPRTCKCNLKPQRQVTPLPPFGEKCKWKPSREKIRFPLLLFLTEFDF